MNSFKVIREDENNSQILWLSTPLGMVSFDKKTQEFRWQFLESNDPQSDYLRKSSTDFLQIGDKLLVGTHGEGFLFDIKDKSLEPIHPIDGQPKNLDYIVEINVNNQRQIQITYLNGLGTYDPNRNRLIRYWLDKPEQGKIYGVRLLDSKGRVWLNSSRKCVIYDPVKQITQDYFLPPSYKEQPTVFKKIDRNRLALLNRKSNICHIFDTRRRKWRHIRMKSSQIDWKEVQWNDLIQLRNGAFLMLAEDKVYTLDPGTGVLVPYEIPVDHTYPGFTKALLDRQDRLWIATRRVGLLRKDRRSANMIHYLDELNSKHSSSLYTWITDLMEDRGGNIWVRLARSYAIYENKKDRFRVFSHYESPENTFRYIRNFSEDPTGDVWVASEDTGLGRTDALRVEEGIVQKLSVRDGLFSDEIKQICFDLDANLWMLTKNGLSRYHSKNPNVWNYPWDRGIPEAHSILTLDDGTLSIARMDGGISLLSPDDLIKQKNIPQPYVTAVVIKDQIQYDAGNRIDLKNIDIYSGRDYLSIEFSALGYSNPKEFAYRLEGVDSDWVLTSELRSTSYSNLRPRNYKFWLKSRLVGGEWSKEVMVNIYLVPKWYETYQFRAIMIIIFLVITYWIYRWRLEEVRRQERVKAEFQQRLNEVEMQSLRSQMNPHFLFNSLNSIQLYIIKNKQEKAVEYLGRFSRLMRLILQNSRSQTVPLKQELEALELYMELERLRFSEIFDFSIEVADNVQVHDFEIPPMILQPFVENAIWHGIQPLDRHGHIRIDISFENEYLHCIIEDNGIGREASAKLKQKPVKQHKSMGMKITADRLEMINHDTYGTASMEIEDLYDDAGAAAGTRVMLRIPIE